MAGNAIRTQRGFNVGVSTPLDCRFIVADESERFGNGSSPLNGFNVYEGLITYQVSDDSLWVLTDPTNISNAGGWTILGVRVTEASSYDSGTGILTISQSEGDPIVISGFSTATGSGDGLPFNVIETAPGDYTIENIDVELKDTDPTEQFIIGSSGYSAIFTGSSVDQSETRNFAFGSGTLTATFGRFYIITSIPTADPQIPVDDVFTFTINPVASGSPFSFTSELTFEGAFDGVQVYSGLPPESSRANLRDATYVSAQILAAGLDIFAYLNNNVTIEHPVALGQIADGSADNDFVKIRQLDEAIAGPVSQASDVNITSAGDNQFLQYDSTASAFVNITNPTFPEPTTGSEAATMNYVDNAVESIPATGVIPHTRSDDTVADTETELYSIGDTLFSRTNRTLTFEISPTDFADIGWVEDSVVVVGFRTDGDTVPREEVSGTVATLPSDTNADTNINVTIDLSIASANRVQGLLSVGIYGTNSNDSGFIPANTSALGRGISFISPITEHRFLIDAPFILAQPTDGLLINDFAKIGQYQQADLVLQTQLNRLSETVAGISSEGTGGYLERYVVDTGTDDDLRVNVGSTVDVLHSIPLEFPAGGFTEGTGIDTFEAVTLTADNTMFPRPLGNTGGTYISVDRVQDYRIKASVPISYSYYTALTGGLVSATQSADITVNIHEAVIVSQTDPDDTSTWVVEPGELIKSITQTHTVEAGASHIPFSTTELGYGEVDLDFNFDAIFSNKGTDNGFFVEINTARYLNEAGRVAVDAIVIAPSGIRAVNSTARPSAIDVSHGGQAITSDRVLFEKGGVFMAYLSGDDLDVTPGSGFRVQEEAPAETYTSDLATAGVVIRQYTNITGYDETWYEYENLTISGGNTLKVETGSSVWSPSAPAIGSGGIYVDPTIAAPVIDIDNVFLFTT